MKSNRALLLAALVSLLPLFVFIPIAMFLRVAVIGNDVNCLIYYWILGQDVVSASYTIFSYTIVGLAYNAIALVVMTISGIVPLLPIFLAFIFLILSLKWKWPVIPTFILTAISIGLVGLSLFIFLSQMSIGHLLDAVFNYMSLAIVNGVMHTLLAFIVLTPMVVMILPLILFVIAIILTIVSLIRNAIKKSKAKRDAIPDVDIPLVEPAPLEDNNVVITQ